jgi:hypothetical protein
MDHATYTTLNRILLKEQHLTIEQFLKQLKQTHGEEAPLVKDLEDWGARSNYSPSRLLNLHSTLGPKVRSMTPNLNSMEEVMRLAEADINTPGTLQNMLLELFTVQQLYKWVTNYEAIYNRAVTPD